MNIHYRCTQCGICCRNIKVPLTATEAIDWLKDGNQVQIICEASPWIDEPAADDATAAHLKRRSFAATSGSMPVRIVAMLVANLVGDCPNLLPDQRCGIYERRPLVCRIYPAEINPTIRLEPGKKACPPEAWASDLPLLMQNGRVMNDEIRRDVRQWRDTDVRDVNVRHRLCAALNIADAAVVQEGFLVYSPKSAVLLSALRSAIRDDGAPTQTHWRFVTDRGESIGDLSKKGAVACHSDDVAELPCQYIGLKRS